MSSTQKARVSSSVLVSRCGSSERTPPSLTIDSLAAALPELRLMSALATARSSITAGQGAQRGQGGRGVQPRGWARSERPIYSPVA